MLLSIISPTYNEADNIIKFVNSIELILKKYDYEIIFVDDNSSDKTHEIIKNLSSKKPNVRCLRRIGRRGLSGACIEGIHAANSTYIAVIDCDLQHDEKLLVKMLDNFKENNDLDLIIGSRYVDKGESKNGFSFIRDFHYYSFTIFRNFFDLSI